MKRSFLLAMVFILAACPKPKSGPDGGGVSDAGRAGDAGVGADAGSGDGGPADAGLVCRLDDDCAVLMQGLRCGDDGGCIPATGCNITSDCQNLNDPGNYCYEFGIQCRCVPESNDSGFPGVCRRRRPVCSPCTDDAQCGSDPVFVPPGACKPVGDSGTYCLQKQSPCGCGMIDDGTGYCRPQSNACVVGGCSSDMDCASTGQVCNTVSCLCETRCRWDFQLQKDVPDCPPGTICWVDSANLDGGSPYYGTGRCRPPCTSDAGCYDTSLDPYGGLNLKCAPEKVGNGVSADRCRANGQCMDDRECPTLPVSQPDLGYCDRGSFTCQTDCRLGNDPITGLPFQDCRSGYACQLDAGQRVCAPQTCVQLGGALQACFRGEYCCGEDIQGTGTPETCWTDAGLDPNHCYPAPVPPFCTSCMADSDCAGQLNPNGATLPPVCVAFSMTQSVCAPATYNSDKLDDAGVPRFERGCPQGYTYRLIRPLDQDLAYSGLLDTCAVDADCNVGTDAGRCGTDPFHLLPDGGHSRACLCSVPGSAAGCPNDPDSGVTSVCSNLTSLANPQICIHSFVCMAGSWVTQDAGPPNYGCGL